MNVDNTDIEKDIFKMSDHVISNGYFLLSAKCKITLTNEKNESWWLTLSRNYTYEKGNFPFIHYDTSGIYVIWFKYLNKYFPLEVGRGKLSKRIPIKFYSHLIKFDCVHNTLHLSLKGVNNSIERKKLEIHYIKKLSPIFNKHYNDLSSEIYLKNLKAFHDYQSILRQLRIQKSENLAFNF